MSAPVPESSRPARAPRRFLARLLVAGSVFLGLLAALELVVRLLPPPTINTDMAADPLIGYRMPANLDMQSRDEQGRYPFRLTSLGFRGPELPEEGDPLPPERVLLVGDSFLSAWAVREERWVGTSLRRELAQRGIEASVHALSCKDIGTAQELLLLREYGPRARPTTVVLFLYPGNDLLNNTPALAGLSFISPGDYFRPYLVPDAEGGFETRYALPRRAVLRRSRLFSWGEALWLRGKERTELMERLSGGAYLSQPERTSRKAVIEEQYELFRPAPEGSPWRDAWSITESLVRAHRDEAARLGARFVVVVIPQLQQVERGGFTYSNDASLRRAKLPSMGETLDWNLPETRLEGFLHAEGIAHVMLLGTLRREMLARRTTLYVPDGHLDSAGHELMAAALARRMEANEDQCFRPETGIDPAAPIDVDQILAVPFSADFTAARYPMLIINGWKTWLVSDPDRPGGWQLAQLGTMLLPRNTEVTLRGKIVGECPLPVTLQVLDTLGTGEVLHEETFTARGPFELAFRYDRGPESERWWLVGLQVDAEPKSTTEVRVLLTGLEAR